MESALSKFLFMCLFLNGTKADFSYRNILENFDIPGNHLVSPKCLGDVTATITALSSGEMWALKLVDSSSKIPSGILRGNIMPLGSYDECVSIEVATIAGILTTRFCKASLNIGGNATSQGSEQGAGAENILNGIQLYFCVPSSCSARDLQQVFKNLANFDDEQCFEGDSGQEVDALAICAIIIFSFFLLMTILSTVYDIYTIWQRKEPYHPATRAFSLYTNGRKLFHLGETQQLSCLNGLKSISMLWVVLGHVYMAYLFVPLDNYVDVYNWMNSAHSQFITGATVSVDSFLLIGGFLTIYTFQTVMDKGIKFNVPLYYIHRYLRLTPALAAMLLAHAALFKYFGSGPVWEKTDTFLVNGCKQYWWSTLLYIQNYVNPNGVCIPQSWYLSVDMQLFIISPLILVGMRRWPIWGYASLGVLSFASILASFLTGWFYELNGQMSGNISGNILDFMQYYYMPTHTRMSPYLFGIMLGFAVYKLKKTGKKVQLDAVFITLLWAASLALLATCVYSGHNIQFKDYDRLENAFFIALIRPTWAIALCWLIFACVMDLGGPINQILSWPIFQILSRLSYSIYLVHYSFIFITNFRTRSPLSFGDYNAMHKFWGDLAFTIAISIVWTLVFESPIIVLEKTLLGRRSRTQENVKKLPV